MITEPDPLAKKIAVADSGAEGEPLAPGPAPAGMVALSDDATQWIEAAINYGGVLRSMCPPHVQPHWTDERLRAVGVALARCAKHYGWTFGNILTHPGAVLAGAAFPLVWPFIEPYFKAAMERDAGGGSAAVNGAPGGAAADGAAKGATVSTIKPLPE